MRMKQKDIITAPEWIYGTYFEPELEALFEDIEKAIGFKLFVWQKSIIAQGKMRRAGQSTAWVLKELVMPRCSPIDHTTQHINSSHKFDRKMQLDIKQQLDNAGILTNPIARTKDEYIQMVRSWNDIARPVEAKPTFKSNVSGKWY